MKTGVELEAPECNRTKSDKIEKCQTTLACRKCETGLFFTLAGVISVITFNGFSMYSPKAGSPQFVEDTFLFV